MMANAARYDTVADFYETFAGDDCSHPTPAALLALLPGLEGRMVLDLACGHGRLTRELARRGATTTGVDISAALIDKARAREQQEQLGVTYLHADATAADALPGTSFEGVTCLFSLSDIDNFHGAVATTARVLLPGGFFVFSGLHPCFPGWPSRLAEPHWNPNLGYYQEGWWLASGPSTGVRAKVGSNHRMLSTYLNALIDFGLSIERVVEPGPGADWAADTLPGGPVPIYLTVRARRTG